MALEKDMALEKGDAKPLRKQPERSCRLRTKDEPLPPPPPPPPGAAPKENVARVECDAAQSCRDAAGVNLCVVGPAPWDSLVSDKPREKCMTAIKEIPRCVRKELAHDMHKLKRTGKRTAYKCVELPRRSVQLDDLSARGTRRKCAGDMSTYTAQVTTFRGGKNDAQLGTFQCQHVAALSVAAAIADPRLRTRTSIRAWLAWMCTSKDPAAAVSMWRSSIPVTSLSACTQRRRRGS